MIQEPLIIAICIFVGIFSLGAMVVGWLTTSSDRFSEQYEAEAQTRDQGARVIRALGATFESLAKPFDKMAEDLDLQLTYAGRPYGGVNGQQYLAAAIVLGMLIGMAVGAFFGLNTLMQGTGLSEALSKGLRWSVFAAFGIAVYLIIDVRGNAQKNSDELEREFPFFLDLAVLVVQAGGTPRRALSKYVEAAPGTPLSREIAITAKDADSTSFDEALHRMIDRVQPVSVKTILKNLAQGEKSSGEAEQFYSDQAEELRYLREEMATRTAERLKTNIVLPVFLMMMAIILAALTPTIVSIRGQGFF